MKNLGIVGLIGRFKPLHNGGALMLENICKRSNHVIIGLGSSNKYNLRNPFTAQESKEMIDAFLSTKYSNYSFVFIPDYAHIPKYKNGEKWKQEIIKKFGKLDYFISGNEYVIKLLSDNYKVIHPVSLIPVEQQIILRATRVRYEIALENNWKKLVPKKVVGYLEKGLIQRFIRQFGLETIAKLSENNYFSNENMIEEKMHAQEI